MHVRTADHLLAETEATKDLVRRYYDACNRGDLEAVFACLHPDCVHHSRLSEYPKDGVAFAFETTFRAFPDMHWTIVELIAEGDSVAALVRIEGTHQGDYLGQAGTGRRMSVLSVDIARVRDGRFVEHRGVLDELHLLAQIGVVPETYLVQMS
ncbi:MAG: ester cyclase [Ilumatobacteraceae bacterium]